MVAPIHSIIPLPEKPLDGPGLKRFMSLIHVPEDKSLCWPWIGGMSSKGRGRFRIGEKLFLPYRVAYLQFVGPIPEGKLVCHSCDNGACCNPAHLVTGTHSDNMRDAMERGRRPHVTLEYRDKIADLKASELPKVKALLGQRISLNEIGRRLGVSGHAVESFLRRHGLSHQSPWSKKPGRKAVSK